MIANIADLHNNTHLTSNVALEQAGVPKMMTGLLSLLITSTRDAEHCVHQPSGGKIPSVFKFILDNMSITAILKVPYPSPHSRG